jgi:DNA-binding SARP family transcriptional activator/tetratricopeptide (TPR) repeat protein
MRAYIDGNEVVIKSFRDRLFLATLVLKVGDTAPVSHLVEAIWGQHPPKDSRSQLHGCAWRLRRQLADAGGSRQLITTDPAGYRLTADPYDIDLHEFRRLRGRARRAAASSNLVAASRSFRAALALWRGPALAGIESDLIQQSATALDEERIQALEECFEVELADGEAGRLIPDLTELVRQHPFREKLHGELMLAHYRADRQADALAAYRNIRQLLLDELGMEPGDSLQELHRRILKRDASLRIDGKGSPPQPPSVTQTDFQPAVPRTLPPDIPDFVGRGKLVAAVVNILTRSEGRGSPVVVITGPAGVGKTALSIRVAYELRQAYQGGHLYVDLHGFDADSSVTPFEVLGRFLRSLGVDGAAIPITLDERAELYRNLLAGRAALVLLDNAAADDQILPLIPGEDSCGVLVTSRRRLGSTLGANTINVDPLEPAAAADMVSIIAGAERATAEPDAVSELTRLCGHLPLGIRIAAGKLATKPHWSVSKLARQLRDEHRRLDRLTHGALDVRASIALSYRTLDEKARCLLRRLGDVNLPEVTPWVCAALLDASIAETDEVIEQLFDAQLIEVTAERTLSIRYRFHDLVRIFACERATQEESLESLAQARTRAVGACLFLTTAAYRVMFGGDYQNIVGTAPRWAFEDRIVGTWVSDPLSWFDAERQIVTALINRAADWANDDACWELACTASPLYQTGRHYDDWQAVLGTALAAARRLGDDRGQAAILYRLGWICTDYTEYAEAKKHLELAATLFDKVGDDHGSAIVTGYLGMVERNLDHDETALECFSRALPVLRDWEDRWGEAFALRSTGQVHLKRTNYDEAAACFESALTINRAIGCLQGQAQAIFWQGMLRQRQARYQEAEASFREALDITRTIRDRSGQAQCHRGLALCYQGRNLLDDARRSLEQALDLIRQPRSTQMQIMIREAIVALGEAEPGWSR